jgi:hypothetical protein
MRAKDFRLARLEFDEDTDILYYHLHDDQEIDVDQMQEMVNYVKEFIGERKHRSLVYFSDNVMGTPEARKLYADNAYIKEFRVAEAFLVKSVSVRIITNFFIKVMKPKVKTRLFSDQEEAVEWLQKTAIPESTG